MDRFASLAPDPEQQASNSEVRRLLEEAVERLPDAYRTIFIWAGGGHASGVARILCVDFGRLASFQEYMTRRIRESSD